MCRFQWILPNCTKENQYIRVGFPLGGEATFFRIQPLFSIKRPSNATGPVLFVMINMLSVHLWWWFGLASWFLLCCLPAGRSPLLPFSLSHLFFVPSSVLLPSNSLSSALAAIKQPRHFFACQVVHINRRGHWRGLCGDGPVAGRK